MTKIAPPSVIVLRAGGSYKSLKLEHLPFKGFAKERPVTLEIIRHFASAGLICPTIEFFPSQQFLTLTYECQRDGSLHEAQIKLSETEIRLYLTERGWMDTTLERLKAASIDISGYLKDYSCR